MIGVIDTVSTGFLTAPVSGLLGLAWETIATSQRMPFWQTLAASGAWDSPLFAVQLTRWEIVLISARRAGDLDLQIYQYHQFSGTRARRCIESGYASSMDQPNLD